MPKLQNLQYITANEITCVGLQLVAAEERCALAETEIREEVSAEMASLLHDMEANYKVLRLPFAH